MQTDYYECLGLTKTASHQEVKQAYRKLALVLIPFIRNITPIRMKIKKRQRKYSHKSHKHILVITS